jgi:iron complex outermembrane receptor protein
VQDQERPSGAVGAYTNGTYNQAKRDDYWLVNARLGVGGENWSIIAFGRNIGDEEWLQEIIPAPEFGGSFIHPGTLSRYGVEATYRF